MSDPLLLALKAGFLVLLFLFVWRVVRITASDLAGPAAARAASATPRRRRGRRAAEPAPNAPAVGAGPRLVVLSSPVFPPATIIRLDRAVVFGRAAASDVVLEGDGYASSRHSEVVAREGARVLRDLGSTNGTHVDGLAIAGERVLADGDLVRIGETELRYEA